MLLSPADESREIGEDYVPGVLGGSVDGGFMQGRFPTRRRAP